MTKPEIKKMEAAELSVSPVMLNHDNFCPFVEMTYRTPFSLDDEQFFHEKMFGFDVVDLMVQEYRMKIEPEVQKIRERLTSSWGTK